MFKSVASPDLLIRIVVIALTSMVLAFITRDASYDLHFKLRKDQPVSNQIQIIEVGEQNDFEVIMAQLEKAGAQEIFISHFLHEKPGPRRTPYTINEPQSSLLNLEVSPDRDGLVRQIQIKDAEGKTLSLGHIPLNSTLNFRGKAGTFEVMQYFDWRDSGLPLQHKLVILRIADPLQSFTTPVGLISESEMVATLLDNLIEKRFLKRSSLSSHLLILLILLGLSLALLIALPSTLALVGTFLLGVLYLSLSIWIFDHLAIWTPILTPLVQLVLTFLLISNYKYVLNEQTKWDLEKQSLLFQEVEEMKTNFLSLFSHDLKTPLAKIIGLTELVTERVQDESLRADLEKIHSASRELERYIKRILKMSQVQSKNIAIEKAPTDINQLIERSVQQNLYSAQQKDIHFEKELQPLFMVDIDGPLIQEVIINFIENAITYSPKGSTVRIRSQEHKDFIKVSVIDQGPGIPPKAQESIWEKYYRFDTGNAGYGLGLYLSRYVVQLHNGKVYLNSKEGAGCEFGFLIPIPGHAKENHEST